MKKYSYYTTYQRTLIFLLTIAGYLIFGYGGLGLATLNPNASPIWFASGFSIGVLLIFGTWLTPAVFVGAVLTNFLVNTPLLPLLSIGYGNAIEAFLGAKLISWLISRNQFKNYTELFAVILCATLPTMASAIIGVNSIQIMSDKTFPDLFYAMFTWWSGDAIGIIIGLPVFLEIYLTGNQKKSPETLKFILGFLLSALIFWVNWMVFYSGLNQAFCWILGPMLLVLCFIMGALYSRICVVILAIQMVFLTERGYAVFEFGDLNLNLIYTQCILLNFSLATLFYRPYYIRLKNPYKFILANMMAWICLTIGVYFLFDFERKQFKGQLDRTVSEAINAVQDMENELEILLRTSSAFVGIKPDLTTADWKDYVESLNLGEKLKLINGIGVIRPFSKTESPGMKVKTIDENYASQFDDRFIITLVEPLTSNYKALGVDIGSEQNRRETVLDAKVSHQSVATKPMLMVQKDFTKMGFAVVHPIRGKGLEFVGWTLMPLFFENFFGTSFKPFLQSLKINVMESHQSYFSNGNSDLKGSLHPHYKVMKNINIFGIKYTIHFYPSDVFLRSFAGVTPALALILAVFLYFITSFFLDLITFNQRSEELVERKTRELDSSRMKLIYNSKMASLGEMASGMAHEINNPLSAILVKMEVLKVMLKDKGIENGEVLGELEKVKIITGRISKIVSGLRTFSRSSTADPFEPVLIKNVLNETLDLCGEKFKEKGIKLSVGKIPDVLIICKQGQISQVLLNLLNNSADAIESYTNKWIRIDFIESETKVQILITDSGPGIAPMVAARIMEPFYTTKDPNKGTGLGLSISKGIIEDHQGRLWLDSNNAHTCFILELPTMSDRELGDA